MSNLGVMDKPKDKPSLTYRLTARSLPEIVMQVEACVSRLGATRKVTFRGRKFSTEAMINAVLLHCLSLPEAEQERLLAESTARYEAMIDRAGTGPGAAAEPTPKLPPIVGSGSDDPASEVRPKGRPGRSRRDVS